MTKEEILAALDSVKRQQEAFTAQAHQQIGRFLGRIELFEEMLVKLEKEAIAKIEEVVEKKD